MAIDRAMSASFIAVMSEEEKTKVKEDLKEILERGEDRVWIDEKAGIFECPYTTLLVILRKK